MQRSIQTRKLYSKAEAFSYGNSIPKLILRRSKPSFQPSTNIYLTSKHQPETGVVHCLSLRSSLLTIGRTTEGSNAPHKMSPNCGCATNHQATKVHLGRKLTFPKTNLPENTHSRNTRKCIFENLRSRQ